MLRILVVGGYGVFGGRIVALVLRRWSARGVPLPLWLIVRYEGSLASPEPSEG